MAATTPTTPPLSDSGLVDELTSATSAESAAASSAESAAAAPAESAAAAPSGSGKSRPGGPAGGAAWTPPSMDRIPSYVKIVEVAPRDGLQALATDVEVTVETKIALIEQLAHAGIQTIETGSFVSPEWVPMMKGSDEVLKAVLANPDLEGTNFPVLVPNTYGFKQALEAGAREIAVFTAASESFCEENTNCSIAQSLARCEKVISLAKEHGIRVRGYVSCVLGCPYEGEIDASMVAYVTEQLFQMGCYEVSLGDTIGVGTPGSTAAMLSTVLSAMPDAVDKLAVHFHDTYGQALANITMAVQYGISVVDSSVAGLGGCPYARGASGNVATEDVVYMLQGLGIETGIDLSRLCVTGYKTSEFLNVPYMSRVGRAAGKRAGFRRVRSFSIAEGTVRTRYLPPTVPRKRVSDEEERRIKAMYHEGEDDADATISFK